MSLSRPMISRGSTHGSGVVDEIMQKFVPPSLIRPRCYVVLYHKILSKIAQATPRSVAVAPLTGDMGLNAGSASSDY